MSNLGYDSLTTTFDDASLGPNPGDLLRKDGCFYRWVLFDAGTAGNSGAAGDLVVYLDKDPGSNSWEATLDFSDSAASLPAGVLLTTVADGEYCWVQVTGYLTVNSGKVEVKSDTTASVPRAGIASDTDGQLDIVADDHDTKCAVILSDNAGAGNESEVYLQCLL